MNGCIYSEPIQLSGTNTPNCRRGSLCRNGGRMLFFMKSSAGSDRVLLIASVTHLVSFQKNAPQACALTSFGRQ